MAQRTEALRWTAVTRPQKTEPKRPFKARFRDWVAAGQLGESSSRSLSRHTGARC